MEYRKKNWMFTLAVICFFIKVAASNQVALTRALFDENSYDPKVRPVKNLNTTTTVSIGMTMNQIRELVEITQTLTCAIWAVLRWKDEFLTWDPADYDGLDLLIVPSDTIWTPDITLYNSVDEERGFTEIWSNTNVRISHTGDIHWMTVAQTQTTCRLYIRDYPFDEQLCPMKFGSWVFNVDEVDVIPVTDEAYTDKFIDNEEWELIDVKLIRHSLEYDGGTFSDVTAYVRMSRKPNFYMFTLLFPCILLMVISVAVFWLPAESGEKVSLGVTVLLALTVYQLIITDNIPSTAEYVPLLAQFFGASVVLLGFSVMSAVCILNLHFYGCFGARVPKPIRKFLFGYCAPILCLKPHIRDFLEQIEEMESKGTGADGKTSHMPYHYTRREHMQDVPIVNGNGKTAPMGDTLNKSLEELRMTRLDAKASRQEEERNAMYVQEWQLVACVVDRILFVFFVIATILIGVFIFELRPEKVDLYERLRKKGY
ncbi:unnamed protein product [Owenia fusiformis]|uniref:Uncharacterized protein n=1 Tax=Owenia fusiformis TaxID=6347 RepID=A0A8J1UMH7_OWEFU|nr:unnamed protein product [Owenia fusiformis]